LPPQRRRRPFAPRATTRGRIDLILTDVIMPLMNGRDLAEWLVVRHPDVKVLFMSGYTDDTLISHGVAVGELAFIHKPFTPTTLLQRIREVLDSPASGLRSAAMSA
jgi:two-component system, cell cycle sensor histidine kinase and response regulator CckA